jgi:hypothetical protein
VAAAFACCAVGSPWSFSAAAGGVVTALSALPLVALAYLAYLTHAEAYALWRASGEERSECSRWLDADAPRWRKWLGEARAVALVVAEGGAGEMEDCGLPDGQCSAALHWLQRRFACGEGLSLDALHSLLGEMASARVGKLQRYHEYGFVLGLVGAVFGLGAQIWVVNQMSDGGFLSGGFLSGVVLKAAVTVAGAAVALYARSLLQRQLERFAILNGHIERFVSTYLARAFVESQIEDGDVKKAMLDAAERVEKAVASIHEKLPGAVEAGVRNGAAGAREAIQKELREALGAEVAGPLKTQMGEVAGAVRGAANSILEAQKGFREGLDTLQKEVKSAINAKDEALATVESTVSVLATVPPRLEAVVREMKATTDALYKYRTELEAAIKALRQQYPDSPAGDNHKDQHELTDKLLADIRAQYEAQRELAGAQRALYEAQRELAGTQKARN